ncbi:MAG: hypothetical protein Aurels2KO_38690 [Aureliella sp.]
MFLNVNDLKAIDSPSRAEVQEAIETLVEEDFVVLSRDEHFYIQTRRNEDKSLTLEYRDGGPDKHFATDEDHTTLDDVQRAFTAYLNGDDLHSLLDWQLIVLEPLELGEGEVEYNGAIMDANWPAEIEKAQKAKSISVRGKKYARIPMGKEKGMNTERLRICGDCGAAPSQLHVPGCEVEQCPVCESQRAACPCD